MSPFHLFFCKQLAYHLRTCTAAETAAASAVEVGTLSRPKLTPLSSSRWVFGSQAVFGGPGVMVTVATNLDAPIKVTFPRDLAAASGFSLLGLGDIVLPGYVRHCLLKTLRLTLRSRSIFVALALRFDYSRALKANPPPRPSSNFARPYFYTVFVAYILGQSGSSLTGRPC